MPMFLYIISGSVVFVIIIKIIGFTLFMIYGTQVLKNFYYLKCAQYRTSRKVISLYFPA